MSATAEGRSADVLRQRSLPIDAAALVVAKVGEQRSIALFDDVTLLVEVSAIVRRPAGLAWQGRIVGEDLGTCTVTIENGLLSAGFWSEKGSFGIVPAGRSDHTGRPIYDIQKLAPEAVSRCLMAEGAPGLPFGLEPPASQAQSAPPPDGAYPPAAPAHSARGGGESQRACNCPDDQTIVDVLCVYTTLAKNAAGGLAAIQARVQNAVDAANGAYINSGINSSGANRLQLRIAGYEEVSYDEQSPQWLDHLVRVTDTDDGIMDNVHALRDQHKADTVMLVVDDARFTGGAAWWAIWDQGQAFSCINWRGLGGGDLTMAHELGHNFGCAHDHENDTWAPASYAWGHYFSAGGHTYGTIMAYPGDVRLQYFSNPQLTHAATGEPLGAEVGQPRAAYNAFIIQQTRWVLSNYRDADRIIDCNGNGVADAMDISSAASLDANGNCRPDECEERRYADAQTPGPGEGRSWTNAGGNLREIFDLARLKCSAVNEIWVADGTYTPNLDDADQYGSFGLRSGLAVHGGFQGKSRPGGGETILSQRVSGSFASVLSGEIGAATASDNSYSVVTAYDADASSSLDRFTIEKGYSDWWGAGMYMENSSSHVSDCVLRDNRAGSGGGVSAWTSGTPTFTSCTFVNNLASNGGGGGLTASDGVSIAMDRCEFTGNEGLWGGGVAFAYAAAQVTSCVFEDNTANSYNGGAIDNHSSSLTLTNSLITGNHALADGGAVWIATDSAAQVTNCTIAGNSADSYTGGLIAYFAQSAAITNTVIWSNSGGFAEAQESQLVFFPELPGPNYSRIEGWTGSLGGIGNSGDDPYFYDPPSGDYSLSAGSSCIDAGQTSAIAGVDADVLGYPRLADDPVTVDTGTGSAPVVDIGAIEYQPCAADFDASGFVDLDDFSAFVLAFELGGDDADFDGSGFVDLDDFSAFVLAFEAGC